jgi:hypothetical protein
MREARGLRPLARLCCPGSKDVVRFAALLVIFGQTVIFIFARSVPAIVLSIVGILASAEAYLAAGRSPIDRRVLALYAAYMLVQSGCFVGLGVATLAGADLTCASAANTTTCTNVAVVLGLIMTLGASSVGTFAALNALVVVLATRRGGVAASDAAPSAAGPSLGGAGSAADAYAREQQRKLAL